MSVSALSSPSNGTVTSKGKTVVKTIATETNDTTHVCTNPDQSRILIRDVDGSQYTTVPSLTVSVSGNSITLIKEIA